MTQPPTPQALAAHQLACERRELGYIDPSSGLFVMTSVALAQRTSCCGNGCRHCPWPPDAQARAGRPDVPAWPATPRLP